MSPPVPIVIGTRGSQLATTQTEMVRAALEKRWGDAIDVRLEIISTRGDVDQQSLRLIGGQGIFTREIERAVLDGTVDLAVHSLKDLPTETDDDLMLAAIPPREDVRDVLVTRDGGGLEQLPEGARIGTGSARRQSQLAMQRPDLQFLDLRGNVDTRLRKVHDGAADAVVLAAAGLHRLGLQDRISQYLDPLTVLPSPGQGALGLQMRADAVEKQRFVAALDDAATHASVTAERSFLAALGGGCRAPIAAWARTADEVLLMDGVVLRTDGTDACRASRTGSLEDADRLGGELGDDIKAKGATAILADYTD
ncbi:MAG: hydroxymethylbilane synthase [Candidatus Latescibacterota bacterium]|nr:hydroxymethylbilane synthase [Candidatus Latescibacterota bacterium]